MIRSEDLFSEQSTFLHVSSTVIFYTGSLLHRSKYFFTCKLQRGMSIKRESTMYVQFHNRFLKTGANPTTSEFTTAMTALL
jgi:hypothetical protein